MDGLKFIASSKNFFTPVNVLSRKFRGKFLFYLKQACQRGDIKFFGEASNLNCELNFLDFINSLY